MTSYPKNENVTSLVSRGWSDFSKLTEQSAENDCIEFVLKNGKET
jgi:hypothetical protein